MAAVHDVVVVGAGVIGTSIAYHLAALGARDVVVLDRGQVGSGTSSQSRSTSSSRMSATPAG